MDTTRPLSAWLSECAHAHPDAVAVVDGVHAVRYAELESASNRLARWLVARGVGPGSLVGLCLSRSADFVVAVVAVVKAGAGYLPLDPAYPERRLRFMADNSGVRLILTHRRVTAPPWPAGVEPVDLDRIDLGRGPDTPPTSADRPEDIAYVMYTSGSTGRPKGVMVAHRTVRNLLRWQHDRTPPHVRTALHYAPTSFDVSFQEIFGTLLTGGRLVIVPEHVRRELDALLALIAEHEVQRWFLPAGVLEWAAEGLSRADRAAASLRELVQAGEPLKITDGIRRLAARHGWVLRNQYGPAETHVVSEHVLDGDPSRPSAKRGITSLPKSSRLSQTCSCGTGPACRMNVSWSTPACS
jgi:non-ribosomal peptide synthetase component F